VEVAALDLDRVALEVLGKVERRRAATYVEPANVGLVDPILDQQSRLAVELAVDDSTT
jgi:hypothetical protein